MQQQVQYAQNQKGQLASYIKGGGLKPMIGEWALAGELTCASRYAADVTNMRHSGHEASGCSIVWEGRAASLPPFVAQGHEEHFRKRPSGEAPCGNTFIPNGS